MRHRSFALSPLCQLALADGTSNATRLAFTAISLLLAAQCAAAGAGGFNYQFPTSYAPAITATAVDAAGNIYVTGSICAANFPTTAGAFQTQFGGGACNEPNFGIPLPGGDAFVMKLDPTGGVVWATYLGGSGYDAGNAIAVDSAGNVYVAGETASSNFPVTPRAAFPNLTTTNDAFVVKLNPAGSQMIYGTYLPGIAFSGAVSMALDSNGNTYVVGQAQPAQFNFPTTSGAYETSSSAKHTGVVVKLNPSGSGLVYATYLGGDGSTDTTSISAIAVDGSGSAYVTGTAPPDFPATSRALQPQSETTLQSAFVTKLNPAGSGLIYSTYLGSGASSLGSAIKVDSQGRAYILGSVLSGSISTTPGAFEPAGTQPPWVYGYYAGNFLASLSADGSSLVYSTYMSGATVLDVDASGDAYVAGVAYNGFPVSAGAFQRCSSGFPGPVIDGQNYGLDGFAAELTAAGTLAGATYFGGLNTQSASAIAAAPSGLVSVAAGSQASTNFVASFLIDDPMEQDGPCLSPAIANAAGLDPTGFVTPGEIVSLLGVGIGPETGASTSPGANGLLPVEASGVQVFFDELAAPLMYVQAGQINAQVPWEIAGRSSTQVQVIYNGVATNSESMAVLSTAPGLFYLNYPSALLQGAILNQDGSVNSVNNPAKVGNVVAMFGTGGGKASVPGVTGGYWGTGASTLLASPAVAFIAELNAPVVYAGTAPMLLSGFFQINVRIPPGLPIPPAGQAVVSYDAYVSIAPAGSNVVTVAVQCTEQTCDGRGNSANLRESGGAN